MKEAGIGPGPRGMTEEQFQVLLEKVYTREIEDLLKTPAIECGQTVMGSTKRRTAGATHR